MPSRRTSLPQVIEVDFNGWLEFLIFSRPIADSKDKPDRRTLADNGTKLSALRASNNELLRRLELPINGEVLSKIPHNPPLNSVFLTRLEAVPSIKRVSAMFLKMSIYRKRG